MILKSKSGRINEHGKNLDSLFKEYGLRIDMALNLTKVDYLDDNLNLKT